MNSEQKSRAIELLGLINKLFLNNKDQNTLNAAAIASIASVIGNMLNAIDDFEDYQSLDIVNLISSLYQQDSDEIKEIEGNMTPPFAKIHTGISIDYTDFSQARVLYEKNKGDYDRLYELLSEYQRELGTNKEETVSKKM